MYKNENAENVKIYENYFIKIWKFENMKIQKWKIRIICGCWPPSGPPAAKNQVFLILMWMLAPSKASGGKKSSICFLIFTLLLNAFWHAETIDLVKSLLNQGSKVKNLHCASSYGQNTPKKETWSQCCILSFFQALI